jgi:nitronate monooxygenase
VSRVLTGLRRPVIGAPMAGGPSTPALVAAVDAAGGLGFLAAGYRTVAQLDADLAEAARLGARQAGVNVFAAPADAGVTGADVAAYADRLAAEADRWGATPGRPVSDDDGLTEKVALLVERAPAVVSFTFGLPTPAAVQALHAAGSEVWVTVTAPEEAPRALALGADALVVQGIEAGGHRGGPDADTDEYALLTLLRLVARRVPLPLVAAGGIMDGAALAAVLTAGASAAQLGTALLDCPEAGTSAPHRSALALRRPTRLTRAFTGRRARAVSNAFVDRHDASAPAAFPQLHHLTAPLRAAARTAGDLEGLHLWAGQAYELVRPLPAAELIDVLMAESAGAVERLTGRLS